jgi:hypothetical protein
LAAWRKGGKQKEEKTEETKSKGGEKKVRFAGDPEKEEEAETSGAPVAKKKSFFMGDDDEDLLWKVVELP